MKRTALTTLLLLAGCGALFQGYPQATAPPPRDSYLVLVDFDVGQCPPGAEACARWVGNVCHLHLPRGRWSECAVHELAHCFNGQWHGEQAVGCDEENFTKSRF